MLAFVDPILRYLTFPTLHIGNLHVYLQLQTIIKQRNPLQTLTPLQATLAQTLRISYNIPQVKARETRMHLSLFGELTTCPPLPL